MAETIKNFNCKIANKTNYYLPVIMASFISYIFSVTNRTVSLDSLSANYYGNPKSEYGFIAAKRWGFNIYVRLFSSKNVPPFLDRFMGVLFLLAAAYFLGVLLFRLTQSDNIWIYSLCASFFVSYPLINEIWEYEQADGYISLNFLLAILAVLYHITSAKNRIKRTAVEMFILIPVAAGYESGVFAYISLVLLVLTIQILQSDGKYGFSSFISEGFSYAWPLLVAVITKYIIGYLFIALYKVDSIIQGASDLYWGTDSAANIIKSVICQDIYCYVVRGSSYLPIAEFVLAFVLTLCVLLFSKVNNKALAILSFLLAYISTFLQSVVQGTVTPYRAAQSVHIYAAMSVFLFSYILLGDIKTKKLRVAYLILAFFIIFRQSVFLGQVLALNNQRSENEASIARQLGYDITTKYDSSKKVVFVGVYHISDWVSTQFTVKQGSLSWEIDNTARKMLGMEEIGDFCYIGTNIQSYLSWGARAVYVMGQQHVKWFFSYFGYDINVLEDMTYEEKQAFEKIRDDLEMQPLQIEDIGEYILVNLG